MNERDKVVVNLFRNGLSLRAISLRLRISRVTATNILQAAGEQTDKRKRTELKEFNGKTYALRPDGYYRATKRDENGKKTFLHRDIFEHHHGRKIKEGWQVDHDDQNKENNSPSNLVEREIDEHAAKGQRWHGHPAQSNNYQRMQREKLSQTQEA